MFPLKSVALVLGLVMAASAAGPLPATEADTRATVLVVEGVALVGTRTLVLPAEQGMQLQIADRIFVLDDSSATLEFADGCRQELSANTILTIEDQGTCQRTTASLTEQVQAMERCATGQLGHGEVLGPACKAAAAAAPGRAVALFPLFAGAWAPLGTSATLWAGGGLAAMGVIYAITNDDDNGPPPLQPQRPPLSPE